MVKLKMKVLIAVFCLTCAVVVHARGKLPTISIPQSNKWPNSKVYVRNADPQSFSCQAKTPAKYRWTFNGTAVENVTGVTTVFGSNGTLRTGPLFGLANSGDYQCFAENAYGTTFTPIIQILGTIALAFKGGDDDTPKNVKTHASKYFKMECKDVPLSVPQWNFIWEKGTFKDGKLTSGPIEDNERLIIDQQGFLHFLWTEMSDSNFIYACSTWNDILLIRVRNTETISLTVEHGDQLDRTPELMYSENVQVYEGEDAELMCIFTYFSSARERMTVEWYRFGKLVGEGHKLVLNKVDQSHDGQYICKAELGGKETQSNFVSLKVVAPPKFVVEPLSKDVPVGSDAVLQCNTTSHNSYTQPPVWFLNAVPLIGCPDRHFECKKPKPNGFSECVHEKKVCDGLPDCQDDSDEQFCPGSCSEDQMWCNGNCIPKTSPCNELICDFPGFACNDKKYCFPAEKKCNGEDDCPDKSDEIGCPGGDMIQRSRFELNSERTQLTLRNVKLEDSACLQCLVRNEYGSSIADACLTIIDKIVLLRGPNSTYDVAPGMVLDIYAEATTDKQWQKQMVYIWQWYEEGPVDQKTGQTTTRAVTLPPKEPFGTYFRISQNGKSMVINFPEVREDDQAMYNVYYALKDRVYTLIIKHDYDQIEVNFTINGVEIVKPTGAPVVEAAATNLWFIALILAILILFIVVALIVCYMYRNRGGTYPLDKKEHQAGHDPAQELKDSGLHDVGRIDDDYDDDKPRADEASLSESVKPYESDDDPTEEYGGDFDVSKFNEDGSFIGLYGDKKSKYSTKEATV